MSSVWDDLRDRSTLLGQGVKSVVGRRHARNGLELCLYLTAYYVAYSYGMSFSHAAASPFWFPDSVLLCALLMNPPRRWWILILAPLPIRLFADVAENVPLWFLLTTFAIDSAKGLLTAVALRRYMRNPTRLETVQEFGAFCLFAVLLVPAASAFAGAATRHLLGHDFWTAWEQWFLGDALAQLVVTPAILFLGFGAASSLRALSPRRRVEGALLAAGLVATAYAAFNTGTHWNGLTDARFYAPVPFLFWAAIRFGMFGASGAIAMTAFISVEAALDDRGPFSGLSPQDTTLALQHFLLLRAAPLYLVAVLIQQRKRVEDSLRESEERFRSMANTAPVMIWTSGPDQRHEFFNQSWLDFSGRSLDQELEGEWARDVHPEDVQQSLATYRSSFEARKDFEMQFRLRRWDGEYRWILNKGVPRDAPDGGFRGYVGCAVDISDRKRAEEMNRNLAHTQRLALMGELTAVIAHEIKQPLTAILANAGAAAILLESSDPSLDQIRAVVSDIHKDGLRADEVIGRMRAMLRKREAQMQPFDLNVAVADALELVAGDALQRHVQIVSELSRGLPLAFGDCVELQQVVLNLLVNAMDAMEATPVLMRHLSVRTAMNGGDALEVAVADRGCGIGADRLTCLFDSFYTTKPEGMGLGLSIARSIIRAHRGRIWAENNADGGATFRFVVPVARPAPSRRRTVPCRCGTPDPTRLRSS
jgi:PAS domain S-box-containing protein